MNPENLTQLWLKRYEQGGIEGLKNLSGRGRKPILEEALVLHYRTPDVLNECLEKLACFAPGVRVVVVDSSPPDETPHVKAELLPVPNHSFAHMLNCGLKLVRTPYAAHLNADVFIRLETLPRLLEAVQRPGVGMVGPSVRTADGAKTGRRDGRAECQNGRACKIRGSSIGGTTES